jgi:hypothetical protein
MRLANKIFLIIIIVLIVAYASAYIFIAMQGRRIVTDRIGKLTGRQVKISNVRMSGPLRFTLDKIDIEGIGKAASVEISPSYLALLAGKTVLYSILVVKPEVTFTMPTPAAPQAAAAQPQEGAGPPQEQANPPSKTVQRTCRTTPFSFHWLRIIDGTIVFTDPSVSPETGGMKITFTNVAARVTNIYELPSDMVTKFELKARIPWKDSGDQGIVSLDGWLNYSRKDMRAELVMKDIDALYLYPYYASWFNLDKTSIEKAKLAFTSSVTGLNNDVTAACHLELTEINFKKGEEAGDQTRAQRIANKVLDFFKAMNDGKVVLNFTVKTKMDSPDFGLNVIKCAFDNTLLQARKGRGSTAAKVMEMPGQVVGGTVKGVTDVSSALIGGVVSVGKELGKSIGISFKREQPAQVAIQETAAEPNATVAQPPVEPAAEGQKPAETSAMSEAVNNTTPASNTTSSSPAQEPGKNTASVSGNSTSGQ